MPELIYTSRPIRRSLSLRSWDNILDKLEKLRRSPCISLSPGWDLPQILDHCTRSIGFAMSGFPDMKHPLFRALIGKPMLHFAYGSLTKKQYERANAMYIGNHLSALEY